MAHTLLNPAIDVISGRIDGFIYRHHRDGSITIAKCARPNPDRELSPARATQIQRFRDAAAIYEHLMQDPALQAAYREKIMPRRSVFSRLRATVIGDTLKPPSITVLDPANYDGAAGGHIRVCATDNVAVARLLLTITDLATGQVIESAEHPGAAEQLKPDLIWYYQTQVDAPAGHPLQLRALAYDLPGNQAEVVRTVLPAMPWRPETGEWCER